METESIGLPDIGQRIRAARRAAGLTQAELGRRLGDSQAAVAQVENRAWVGDAVLAKYAQALGRPLGYFLAFEIAVAPAAGPPVVCDRSPDALAAAAAARQRRARRMALINRAFRQLQRDPTFAGGARSGGVLDLEAKKELVRRYEAARGVQLLPPEIV